MEIKCGATDDFDVCVTFFEGPLMSSVILSLDDETAVLEMFRNGFRDARALKAGYTKDEVEEMNRERAGAKED